MIKSEINFQFLLWLRRKSVRIGIVWGQIRIYKHIEEIGIESLTNKHFSFIKNFIWCLSTLGE